MDTNKDDVVDDTEWITFYEHFIEEFQKYDSDTNWLIKKDEFHKAIQESDRFRYIKSYFKEQTDTDLLVHYFDANEINIARFVYAVQLDYAWQTCVEGEGLGPNRIYCALSITAQRTPKITPASEKAFFQTALTLWDGFFMSQQNGLTAL